MAIEDVYLHPEDYDLEVGSQHLDDLPFWVNLVRREAPTAVLEVGCGTGRLTIPLAREGVARGFCLTGIEPEISMLERARERSVLEPPAVQHSLHLVEGDVRDLCLKERFDLILMPYGVAHHLLDLEEQISVWSTLRQHLRPRGLLGVDLGAPDLGFLSRALDATPRRLDLDVADARNHRLRRSVVSRYAPASQRVTHFYEYTSTQRLGRAAHYPSEFSMHVYFPREIQLLCRLTGYHVECMIGSYIGKQFNDHSIMLIVLARAP
jgi:SAM-dependent methyltransferase